MDPTMTMTVRIDCKTAGNYSTLKARVDSYAPKAGESFTLVTDDPDTQCIEYVLERTRPI